MAAQKQLPRFVEFGKKIIGIGRNFSEHAVELGNAVPTEPVVFLKPSTAYITWPNPIKMPEGASEIHHEVELGLVIGTDGRNIPESAALSHIGGYVLALDMTDRVLQMKLKSTGLPWALAKGFDTACPVSDLIVKDKIPDPQEVDLWLKVNGKMRQEGNTKNMIFSIPFLVSWLSRHFTLERGDVILTGTPSGVGPVKVGDVIECGLGTVAKMSFPVVEGN